MNRLIASLMLIACGAFATACASTPAMQPSTDGKGTRIVHVVSNGWHTAIVVPRAEIAATGRLPEIADFPGAAFLEFGWGDREYYQAKETTIGLTLRAALTATPAVMHVTGHKHASDRAHSEREIVRVGLRDDGFRRLVRAIADSFERPPDGRAQPVSPVLDPNSRFYNARGMFHLFNTCNTWTARTLRAAGIDLKPAGVSTAEDLMTQLRKVVHGAES